MKRLLIILTLGMGGCSWISHATPPVTAIVESRFTTETRSNDQYKEVDILVSTADVQPKDGSIAITALSDRGQAALITETKGAPPTVLKGGGTGGQPSRVASDPAIQRQVVVAVHPTNFLLPGDRIDAVRIDLKVAGSTGWRIAGWSQASNGQTLIDIGSLSDVSSSKLTASTGLRLGKDFPSATIGGESDHSATQTQAIKDATIFNAAVGNDGSAWLEEVAGWRADLSGNVMITVLLSEEPGKLKPNDHFEVASKLSVPDSVAPSGMRAARPDEVQLFVITAETPPEPTKPICGTADLRYRIRHIANESGRASFTESDDQVELKEGSNSVNFLFAPPPFPSRYVISPESWERDDDRPQPALYFQLNGGRPARLVFSTLAEADAFMEWLQQAQPPGGRLHNATVGALKGSTLRGLKKDELRDLVVTVSSSLTSAREAKQNATASCAGEVSPTDGKVN